VQGIYLGAFCNSYQWKVVGGGEVGNRAGWRELTSIEDLSIFLGSSGGKADGTLYP
jgi:hypothetical protein